MFTSRHIPVLLEPVLRVLNPRPGQVIVDCTVGLGGHSAELLRRITPGGRLIGIDFDPSNLTAARKLEPVGGHFDLFQTNFAALPTVLAQAGVESTNAIIADIGVASTQIDDPSRGFSYRRPGPLDMRMDPTRGQPASALLNRLSSPSWPTRSNSATRPTPRRSPASSSSAQFHPVTTTEQLTEIVCESATFTARSVPPAPSSTPPPAPGSASSSTASWPTSTGSSP